MKDGEAAQAPSEPTREGYVFNGWTTDKEGKYLYDFSRKVTEDIALHAQWTKVIAPVQQHTVSYDGNGAIGNAPESSTVDDGTVITLRNENALKKDGYVFKGWSLSKEGTDVLTAGSQQEVKGDTVFYAVWEESKPDTGTDDKDDENEGGSTTEDGKDDATENNNGGNDSNKTPASNDTVSNENGTSLADQHKGLAKTGAAITGVIIASIALLLGGIALTIWKRHTTK